MTDPITDAVRRIKRLQQDVERLKAGTSEEGEPRLFVSEDDRAAASDESDVRPNDIAAAETARTSDTVAVRDRDTGASETAIATDSEAETVGEAVAPLYWNDGAWNTSEYPDA